MVNYSLFIKMKKIVFLILLMLHSILCVGQDIIVKKNTDEIQAKVLEVGLTEIKYKNWNNQEGPTYVINKSEVFMVKYANGDKESYADYAVPEESIVSSEQPSSNMPHYWYNGKAKSFLMINDKAATVEQSKQILGEETYRKLRNNAAWTTVGAVFIGVGAPVLMAGVLLGIITEKEQIYGDYYKYVYPYVKEAIIGMSIGGALCFSGVMMVIKLPKKNDKIVEGFNNRPLSSYQGNKTLSLSAAPNRLSVVLKF